MILFGALVSSGGSRKLHEKNHSVLELRNRWFCGLISTDGHYV